MKLLIIGGTIFVGRRLAEAAARAGHEVTVFHRGRHNADGLTAVEVVHGDRNTDMSRLRGRRWDAAIDTCGFTPGAVRRVVEAIQDSVDHYTFISSVSVYQKFGDIDETAPVQTISSAQVKEAEAIDTGDRAMATVYGEWYGALKALSESAADELMPGRVLTVRPGLIVGAYDHTDRFTYWVRRVAEGDEVLAPGRPARVVAVIDARDLAEWTIHMIVQRRTGVYNATGNKGLTMADMLDEIRLVSRSDARFTWASESFLKEQHVERWTELPLWIPETDNGIFEISSRKAIDSGLIFRRLADTIADTLSWDASRPRMALRAGLTRDRERALLRQLHS